MRLNHVDIAVDPTNVVCVAKRLLRLKKVRLSLATLHTVQTALQHYLFPAVDPALSQFFSPIERLERDLVALIECTKYAITELGLLRRPR